MISDKVIELINQELDGTLSRSGKVQLEKYLEANQESRDFFNKLQLLHKKLKEVKEIEPPADFKESVLKALPVVHYSPHGQDASLKSKIIDLMQVPRFQMAGMFTLGAAAALLFLVITQNLPNWENASTDRAIGTIISPDRMSESFKIDAKQITIDDYKVEVTTTRSENTVFVRIDLATSTNQVVQVVASSEGAENFRFNALEFNSPNLIYANFGNDFISAAIAGPGNWMLAFDDPEGTTETLTIELKTEKSSVKEVLAIQKNTAQSNANETSSNQ